MSMRHITAEQRALCADLGFELPDLAPPLAAEQGT
jgi:hypothetical protein